MIVSSKLSRLRFTRRLDGVSTETRRDPANLNLRTQTPHSIAGEPLGRVTESGVSTTVQLDEQRRAQSVGPGVRRRTYGYDDSKRLTSMTEQNGTQWTVNAFDNRSRPTSITTPGGGTIAAGYDILGRRTSQTVTFNEFVVDETFGYDALGRLRAANDASGGSSLGFRYTPAGHPDQTTLTTGGQTWTWTQRSNPNGTWREFEYPSATASPSVQLSDQRTPAGQLLSTNVDGQPLISNVTYAMAGAPERMTIGPVTREDRYDDRRRFVSRSYTVGGSMRADLRYGYDTADREIARQSIHSGGRADLFLFDDDSRLLRAEIEARPELEEDGYPSREAGLFFRRRSHSVRRYEPNQAFKSRVAADRRRLEGEQFDRAGIFAFPRNQLSDVELVVS